MFKTKILCSEYMHEFCAILLIYKLKLYTYGFHYLSSKTWEQIKGQTLSLD